MFGRSRRGIGWLGATVIVVVTGGLVAYALLSGQPQPDPSQGAIRGYYESAIGGNVPQDVANDLRVDLCSLRPLAESQGIAIVPCDVTVGNRKYRPCFGFDIKRVVSGPYQIELQGCDRLVYDASRRTSSSRARDGSAGAGAGSRGNHGFTRAQNDHELPREAARSRPSVCSAGRSERSVQRF